MAAIVGWIWYNVHDNKKTMKGSVIVDHLADNAIKGYKPLNFNFPNKDMLVVEKEKELN